MDISVRTIDDDGITWSIERIGRTSGIVGPKDSSHSIPGPADIVRFVCESESGQQDRETIMAAGLLSDASDAELVAILKSARRMPRPKRY